MSSAPSARPSSNAPEPKPYQKQAIKKFKKYNVNPLGLCNMYNEEGQEGFEHYSKIIRDMDPGTLGQATNVGGGMASSRVEAFTRTQREGHATHADLKKHANPKKRNLNENEYDSRSRELAVRTDTASKKLELSPPADFCSPAKCKKKPFKREKWFISHCVDLHSDILGGTVNDLNREVVFVCSTCRENEMLVSSFPTKEDYLRHHFKDHYDYSSTTEGSSAASPATIASPSQGSPLHSNGHSHLSAGQGLSPIASTAYITGLPQVTRFAINNSQFTRPYEQAPPQTPSLARQFEPTRDVASSMQQPLVGNQEYMYSPNFTPSGLSDSQMMTDYPLLMRGGLQSTHTPTTTPDTGGTYFTPPSNHNN